MINLKSIGEGNLNYLAGAADIRYYNLAKDLAMVNSRNEEVTDRKGNLYGYWCKITAVSVATAPDILSLVKIPNTWKVRNAFRKFHFAREHMFREAGVTKREMGKYGRTIRAYFSQDHITNGDQVPRLFDANSNTPGAATGGVWTYSRLASAPSFLEGFTGSGGLPIVDSYTLTILDDNDVDATSTSLDVTTWDSVGMVESYNLDRMEEIPDATAGSAIQSPNNPLSALFAQSVMSGEVTEIAEDQELEAPPYDITPAGDSTNAVYEVFPITGTTLGGVALQRSLGVHFIPAGILVVQNGITNSNAIHVEVLGKELCKDVA